MSEETLTKTCTKCKEEKPVSEFSKQKDKKDGLRCNCKECIKNSYKIYSNKNKSKDIDVLTKICTICGLEKTLEEFHKNNSKKYGVNSCCSLCEKENKKEYVEKHKNEASIYQKEYRIKNIEKLNIKSKKYRDENPELLFCRRSLKRIIDNWQGKRYKYESVLGYTVDDLKSHLSKFDAYTKNHHIDHIIPISVLSEFIKDPIILARFANDLRNLIPLTKKDNHKKYNKLTIEYIPYFHLQSFLDYVLELQEYISNSPSK